jgi:hypothetical protein
MFAKGNGKESATDRERTWHMKFEEIRPFFTANSFTYAMRGDVLCQVRFRTAKRLKQGYLLSFF